jgi:hypothetical protein
MCTALKLCVCIYIYIHTVYVPIVRVRINDVRLPLTYLLISSTIFVSFIPHHSSILNLCHHSVFICFICVLFHDGIISSDYITTNGRMINEWRIVKDVEGSSSGPLWGNMSSIAWRNSGNPQRTSVRIVNIPAEIWTGHLPKACQKCNLLTQLPRRHYVRNSPYYINYFSVTIRSVYIEGIYID